MTNKRFPHPATLFFLLTLLVAFLSWVGNVYGWSGVQSLLSAEGLRWQLRDAVPGFLHAPMLGHLLVLAFGVGLWMHSGLGSLWVRIFQRHACTRKEKRALCWSAASVLVCVLMVVVLAWGPWGIVRSITGSLKDSPLADGLTYLLSSTVGLAAIVYGYAVDYYRTDRDLVRGLSYGFVCFSAYFITLFFVVRFFTSLHYSGLDAFFGLPPEIYQACYSVCALAALAFSFERKKRNGF